MRAALIPAPFRLCTNRRASLSSVPSPFPDIPPIAARLSPVTPPPNPTRPGAIMAAPRPVPVPLPLEPPRVPAMLVQGSKFIRWDEVRRDPGGTPKCPKGSQNAPKWPQSGPKLTQNAPKCLEMAPKWPRTDHSCHKVALS